MTDAKTWESRVAEWKASGLSAEKFCEGKEFRPHALYSWASELKKKASKAVPLVKVVRPLMPTAPQARRHLEVQTARVLIPMELNTALVGEILKALMAASGETR